MFQETRGSVQFLDDGRAIIRALQSPDISTMVHEIGHVFRRDLPAADLEAIALLGGLKDGAEFRNLEAQFQQGVITSYSIHYTKLYERIPVLFPRHSDLWQYLE